MGKKTTRKLKSIVHALRQSFDKSTFCVNHRLFSDYKGGVKGKDGLCRECGSQLNTPLRGPQQYGGGVDVACGCTASFCFHH